MPYETQVAHTQRNLNDSGLRTLTPSSPGPDAEFRLDKIGGEGERKPPTKKRLAGPSRAHPAEPTHKGGKSATGGVT